MSDEMTIGERIRLFRTRKGKSQAKMADEIGYKQITLSLWERDKFAPSLTSLIDLATYFGTDLNTLCGWKGNSR